LTAVTTAAKKTTPVVTARPDGQSKATPVATAVMTGRRDGRRDGCQKTTPVVTDGRRDGCQKEQRPS